ncbi:amino acid permease [Pseudarthrobacter sp. J75]|uniref:amino acid permease n=1 Tax=unclassified Pseudarthrobacter TaxID=2647000 RepID=UPI002E81812F|nr:MULTISPECIES: amino acid permease [unclassified Pseudarthrobacter]MEE2522420.1 amino acid permease [Pseudarthrobacter sp. J47]MEE2529249.1 amino acid permease [Pseudarthrobacter sp. J75]
METAVTTAAPPETRSGLGRSMNSRQLTMMGLGSAIGTGLFLGSGVGVQAAGPAVLLSYLVAGTLVIIVMQALGELAAANPSSGAFSVYTQKAFGKTAGSTVGWLWWFQLVVVIAAEALGAAALLASVFPGLPVWLLSLAFIGVFSIINVAGVKNYGEFEFWFAILKVAAIIMFLMIGAALIFGWLPNVASPGLTNIFGNGGFAPAGWAGIASALLVVVFAFGGTEIVSVAAAETADPVRSVGKAIRTVVWRIMVFYIGSLAIIVTVVPWDSEALSSPFAAVLAVARIPGAETAIILVAVVALLSALNANLYGASRMIYSLAERGDAPRLLLQLNRVKAPVVAVLVSVAVGIVSTVLELFFPDRILPALLNLVGSTVLLVWAAVLLSQFVLRRRADEAGQALTLRMRAFPYLTMAGMVILAAILILTCFDPVARTQLLSTIALTAGIAVACKLAARSRSMPEQDVEVR